MCNLSSIRACLPMPHSAGEHIPWGIILIDLSMVIKYNTLPKVIAKANVTHYLDKKQRCRWQRDGILKDLIAWRIIGQRGVSNRLPQSHPTSFRICFSSLWRPSSQIDRFMLDCEHPKISQTCQSVKLSEASFTPGQSPYKDNGST